MPGMPDFPKDVASSALKGISESGAEKKEVPKPSPPSNIWKILFWPITAFFSVGKQIVDQQSDAWYKEFAPRVGEVPEGTAAIQGLFRNIIEGWREGLSGEVEKVRKAVEDVEIPSKEVNDEDVPLPKQSSSLRGSSEESGTPTASPEAIPSETSAVLSSTPIPPKHALSREDLLKDIYRNKEGQPVAEETAKRIPARLNAYIYLTKQVEWLKNHPANNIVTQEKQDRSLKRLEAKLAAVERKLNVDVRGHRLLDLLEKDDAALKELGFSREELETHPALWVHSNTMRAAIAEHGPKKAFEETAPALTNVRVQRLHGDNTLQASFLRFGVMSDMTNGFFSLQDLMQIQDDETLKKKLIDQIASQIEKGNRRKVKLPFQKSHLPLTETQKNHAFQAIYELEHIDETLEKRREHLTGQMVQFFETHMEARKEENRLFTHNQTVRFVDLRLLHLGTWEMEKVNFCHNETTEYRDQRRIMLLFNGKKLIADPKGPFVDGDNNVHLPHIPGLQPGESLTISTHQLLVAPSGHKKSALQEAEDALLNNRRELSHFSHGLGEEALKALTTLQSNNWDSAAEIVKTLGARAAREGDLCFSLGCFAGKDRTGYAAGKALRLIGKTIDPTIDDQFLRTDLIATDIVWQNTGMHVLKLHPGLLVKGKYEGMSVWQRAEEIRKLAVEIGFPWIKKSFPSLFGRCKQLPAPKQEAPSEVKEGVNLTMGEPEGVGVVQQPQKLEEWVIPPMDEPGVVGVVQQLQIQRKELEEAYSKNLEEVADDCSAFLTSLTHAETDDDIERAKLSLKQDLFKAYRTIYLEKLGQEHVELCNIATTLGKKKKGSLEEFSTLVRRMQMNVLNCQELFFNAQNDIEKTALRTILDEAIQSGGALLGSAWSGILFQKERIYLEHATSSLQTILVAVMSELQDISTSPIPQPPSLETPLIDPAPFESDLTEKKAILVSVTKGIEREERLLALLKPLYLKEKNQIPELFSALTEDDKKFLENYGLFADSSPPAIDSVYATSKKSLPILELRKVTLEGTIQGLTTTLKQIRGEL